MNKIQKNMLIVTLAVFIVVIVAVNLLIRNNVEQISSSVSKSEASITHPEAQDVPLSEPLKSNSDIPSRVSEEDRGIQPEEEISGSGEFSDSIKGAPLLQ